MSLDFDEQARLEAAGYLVEEMIGRGASGEVYLARQRLLDRRVALKRVPDDGTSRRLENEVAALVALEHPGVVRLMEVQRHPEALWFVMEYVDGPTLRHVLDTASGPMPVPDALGIVEQLSVVLDYVSRRGIVHRDLKPGNIFITSGGRCKIGDFGIALVSPLTGPRVTRPGVILGTPAYLCPEQANGHEATAASDLYSLGVIAYELFTGRPPFRRPGNVLALLAAQVSEPPPSPRTLRPELSSAFEPAILAPLAKDPADRPASADEFFSHLSSAADEAWPGWRREVKPVQVAPVRREPRQAPDEQTMSGEWGLPELTSPPSSELAAPELAPPELRVPHRRQRRLSHRQRRLSHRYLVPGLVFALALGGSFVAVRTLASHGGAGLKVAAVHLLCIAGTVTAEVSTNGGDGALVYRWSGGSSESLMVRDPGVVDLPDRVAPRSGPATVVFYLIQPETRQVSLARPASRACAAK